MKLARFPLIPLLAVLGLSLPAQAQPGPGGGRFMRERPADAQRQMPSRRDDASTLNAGARDERSAEGNRRHQLTPEERQQLRRDIRDAGRDIYRAEHGPRRMQRREP